MRPCFCGWAQITHARSAQFAPGGEMRSNSGSSSVFFITLTVLVFAVALPLLAQHPQMTVTPAYQHDVSPPLRDMVMYGTAAERDTEPIRPTRPLPGSDQPAG